MLVKKKRNDANSSKQSEYSDMSENSGSSEYSDGENSMSSNILTEKILCRFYRLDVANSRILCARRSGFKDFMLGFSRADRHACRHVTCVPCCVPCRAKKISARA